MFKKMMALIVILLIFCLIPAMALEQQEVFTNNKGVKIYILNPVKSISYTFTWTGKIVNGFAEGNGVLESYSDGKVSYRYEGYMHEGKRHGKGTIKLAGGDSYQGDWVDNKRTGRGIYKWDNGNIYEGDWIDNKQTGKGIFKWTDGDIYEGDWVADKRSGKGIFKWADGDSYEGDFVDSKFNGKGIYVEANGSIYEGDWVNNKRHGWGVTKSSNNGKIVYEGEWVNGEKKASKKPDSGVTSGKETIGKETLKIYRNNTFLYNYSGDIQGGQPHGKGIAEYPNGDYYKGDWVNGKRHGYGYFQTTETVVGYQPVNGVVNFSGMLSGQNSSSRVVTVQQKGIWSNDKFLGKIDLGEKQYDASMMKQLASEYETISEAYDSLISKYYSAYGTISQDSGDTLYLWGTFLKVNDMTSGRSDQNIKIVNVNRHFIESMTNSYKFNMQRTLDLPHRFVGEEEGYGKLGNRVRVYVFVYDADADRELSRLRKLLLEIVDKIKKA